MLIITGTTTIMTISGVALLYNILQRELLYPSNWPMGSRKFVSFYIMSKKFEGKND